MNNLISFFKLPNSALLELIAGVTFSVWMVRRRKNHERFQCSIFIQVAI